MRLSHHDQQLTTFQRLVPIYKEAIRANLWLYNKHSGQWFTPEEFYSTYSQKELNNHMVSQLLEDIVVRDPIAGVNAGFKQLDDELAAAFKKTEETRAKLQAFMKKVLAYQQSKSK